MESGINDDQDDFPNVPNDSDNDGIADGTDNCVDVPNTFEAGAAATAASVNANFSALITAIDAIGSRVTALEAGTTSSGNVTREDLVGTNYCISFFGDLGQGAADPGGDFASIGSYVGSSKLEITSTTAATFTVVHDEELELSWIVNGASPAELVATLDAREVDPAG